MSTIDSSPVGFQNVSLTDEEAVKEIVTTAVKNLWEAVNTLTRLRPSRLERYRVAIFGSARASPGTFVYDEVKRAAAAFTAMGCDIVTGGGPGLMQAANEGVRLADPDGALHKSVGIRVELPFEQDVNAFVTEAFEHKTFFTRLHHFVLVSDAFIVTPGGIGTVLEMLMVWQLLQVRHLHDTPLILAGRWWDGLLDWTKKAMLAPDSPLVSPGDLDIPQVLPDGPSIVRAIRAVDLRFRGAIRRASHPFEASPIPPSEPRPARVRGTREACLKCRREGGARRTVT